MLKSKWYYAFVGWNVAFAVVGALAHSLFLTIWSGVFVAISWRMAENRYAKELENGKTTDQNKE